MVANDGKLWMSCNRDRRVVCLDPEVGQIRAEIRLPQRIRCLALAGGLLLVGCARSLPSNRGWLHTIDCRDQRIASTAELPGQPRAIAGDGKVAWVACGSGLGIGREGTIERVGLRGAEVIQWWVTEWRVSDLAVIDDELLALMSLDLWVPMYDGGQ